MTHEVYLGGANGCDSDNQWAKVTYNSWDAANRAVQEANGLELRLPPHHLQSRMYRLKVKHFVTGTRRQGPPGTRRARNSGAANSKTCTSFRLTGKQFTWKNGLRQETWHPQIPSLAGKEFWKGYMKGKGKDNDGKDGKGKDGKDGKGNDGKGKDNGGKGKDHDGYKGKGTKDNNQGRGKDSKTGKDEGKDEGKGTDDNKGKGDNKGQDDNKGKNDN